MKNPATLEITDTRQRGKRRWNWRVVRNGRITANSTGQGYASRAKARLAFLAFRDSVAGLEG